MKLSLPRLHDKPQYVFHPWRAVRRAMYRFRAAKAVDERVLVELSWGLPLEVHISDAIGYGILTGKVFDPCVTETMYRLIDRGETVVDVGAHVGYLSALAAARTGAAGAVHAFEPHPALFALLEENARRWRRRSPDAAPVQLHRLAASDRAGTGSLVSGPLFHLNMGLASLSQEGAGGGPAEEVALARLTDALGPAAVGVLKIDVEGHELAVLRGAQELLDGGRVRDIVFEDHNPYPDPASDLLEAAGYALFSLDNDLFGVRLRPPEQQRRDNGWPGPSYLATLDPERARARLEVRGWQVPGVRPGLRLRRRG